MLIEIKSALDILINKYTDLSAESVLEVEVKQRGGGL